MSKQAPFCNISICLSCSSSDNTSHKKSQLPITVCHISSQYSLVPYPWWQTDLQVVSAKPVLNYTMRTFRNHTLVFSHVCLDQAGRLLDAPPCLLLGITSGKMIQMDLCSLWNWIFPRSISVSLHILLSFLTFLLMGLAQYLCAVRLQPALHSCLSHKSFSGQTDKKQTYQCNDVPVPIFQYQEEYMGAKGGASTWTLTQEREHQNTTLKLLYLVLE